MAVLFPRQIAAVPLAVAVGAGFTVSVAAVEKTVPQELLKRARYCRLLSFSVAVNV